MQSVLNELIAVARLNNNVASTTLEGGFEMLAYPEEEVMLVALGFAGGAPVQRARDALLRKRSSNLPRYGAWLPTIFDDGNWYVVRRLAGSDAESAGLSDDELDAAQELLN
ncbi:MAG: hypothetical protein ACRYGK_00655 [Janthinobacterium lividum]